MAVIVVLTNNRSQAVRLPADVRLPDSVKRLDIRVREFERVDALQLVNWAA